MTNSIQKFLIAVISAAFVLTAACGNHEHETTAEKPPVQIEIGDAPVRITVSKNGFEPKTLGVKKGHRIKLEFLRTDEENCGEEIVFPAQEIRKPLAVGEVVPVELTAAETGEIGFTCGMDMLRGKIVVQ